MTCLYGNKDKNVIYDNFHLDNLNSNNFDYSHHVYEQYLQNKFFIPKNERRYWLHTMFNNIPTTPANKNKGAFNVFPLDLLDDDIKDPGTNLGMK